MAINYKNSITTGIGTSLTQVYNPTTTGVQSTVIGLNIANTTTQPVTVSVTMTVGATTGYLIRNATIPAGNALDVVGSTGKLVVAQSNAISVQSSLASSLDVVISAVEVS